MSPAVDVFTPAEAVADAVLYEGYVLYPYRASDAKNRVRWQWGVLVPPDYAEHDPSERSWSRTDCLVEGDDTELRIRVRFLQVQRRTVQAPAGEGYADVPSLDVGDATYLPWDEAVQHDLDFDVSVAACLTRPYDAPFSVPGGRETEDLRDANGTVVGRLVRDRLPLQGLLGVDARRLPGPFGVVRLRVHLTNTTGRPGCVVREDALPGSLVAAHLMLAADTAFVSVLDPPEWAKPYVQECESVGTFPVLAGEPGTRRLVLSSPIILYDHPSVAPESAANFMDATEIDELLSLRTLTLTDREKREARGTDPRAAALIDHVEDMPAELMDRLHGAVRYLGVRPRRVQPEPPPDVSRPDAPWWDPAADAAVSPETDAVMVGDALVRKGSRVRLRPGRKRADAQDMFLTDRSATVAAVLCDVDGDVHLAVSLDDDPDAAEVQQAHGRYLYFAPDEVAPMEAT
jgi:hypothetical protein